MQHGNGFEILRTHVEGKEVSIHVACSISGVSVVSRSHLPDMAICILRADEVECVLLESLSIAAADNFLLVMCGDNNIYQKVLSILGAAPRIGFFIA